MQFNSYIFIFVYLPVFIIIYFIANKVNITWGKFCLVVGSAVFYMYGGWKFTFILGLSIFVNLIFAEIIYKLGKGKRLFLFLSVFGNVALLLYYKYYNFFLLEMNHILKNEFTLKEIILPLGISFFTFQQVMYVVNIYQKNIEEVNFLDYLVYILYFPKLLMGPLVEPKDFILQINDSKLKKVNWDNISYGLKSFSFGLFKKILLADTFAMAVSWGFANYK